VGQTQALAKDREVIIYETRCQGSALQCSHESCICATITGRLGWAGKTELLLDDASIRRHALDFYR
jgi:hypothetical protein